MTSHKRMIAEAISTYRAEMSDVHLVQVVASFRTMERANSELAYLTGVQSFFRTQEELDAFQAVLERPVPSNAQEREMGDFQTPPELAQRVCAFLQTTIVSPAVIVEPTYGRGNFILAALDTFPTTELVYGVEVQSKYEWQLKIALLIRSLGEQGTAAHIELHQDNIFTHEFPPYIRNATNLLLLGNPPWVTSAALGVLDSKNLPAKQNLKAFRGMDALTGKSNFDVSEYILLRLLDRFASHQGTLAMLCKTSTARNIVAVLPNKQYAVADLQVVEIDAKREFGANVEACLLKMTLGAEIPSRICRVASLDEPKRIKRTFGWVNQKFVSDVQKYKASARLDGQFPFVWRQGVKHDLARIMELELVEGQPVNGLGETVSIEPEYIFPILKSSDLREFRASPARKRVIIPQTQWGQDTLELESIAPRLWHYLMKHQPDFERRKSSIYRNKPSFSIFGIGDYSFQPYKVGIAGLYKEPIFTLVMPFEARPVLLDDTCYMLGFDNYQDALFTATLGNSAQAREFLESIIFVDAKRPFTKEVLMRLDLRKIAAETGFDQIQSEWETLGYCPEIEIDTTDWEAYQFKLNRSLLEQPQMSLAL